MLVTVDVQRNEKKMEFRRNKTRSIAHQILYIMTQASQQKPGHCHSLLDECLFIREEEGTINGVCGGGAHVCRDVIGVRQIDCLK